MRKIVSAACDIVNRAMGRALAVAALSAAVLSAHAVPGTLDTTFAGTGVAYTKFGLGNDYATSAVVQPDGKLIVAGLTQDSGVFTIGVVRQLTDGTLDATFGQGGRAIVSFPSLTVTSVVGVGVLADGRIVVGGLGSRTGQGFGSPSFFAVRILASGLPDPSYGFDGGFSLAAAPSNLDGPVAFTLAPDGSALVAGHSYQGYVVLRFLANGVRDTSFGTNGATVPEATGSYYDTLAIAALGDGRFVIAFTETTPVTLMYGRIRVIRYLADGSRDTGYGVGGEAIFDHAYPQGGFKLALAATGEVYIASAYYGYRNGTYGTDVQAVRFSAAGVVDTAWGQGLGNNDLAARISTPSFTPGRMLGLALSPVRVALATYDYPLTSYFAIQSLDSAGRPDAAIGSGSGLLSTQVPAGGCLLGPSIPLADGRWIDYGQPFNVNASRDFSVCRFLATSAFDPAWSATGRIDIDIGNNILPAFANAILALDDGSAITAGYAGINDYDYGVAIAKHRADGSLDPAFGNGAGRFIDLLDGTGGAGMAIAAAPGGKFVVAGRVGQANSSAANMAVMRYLANGSLDTTFASGGRLTADLFGSQDEATSVAVYPDGRILVAGHLSGSSPGAGYLVRLLANGTLDATFGSNGVVLAPFGETSATYRRIRLLDDGRIVVAGYTGGGFSVTLGIVGRLTANGTLDTTFGAGTGKWSDPTVSQVNDFAIDDIGRLVIVGAESSSGAAFARRLLAAGTVDASFGNAGVVQFRYTYPSSPLTYARCVAIQIDGRIVIGGASQSSQLAATRLLPGGAVDLSFAPAALSTDVSNGTFVYPFPSSPVTYYQSDVAIDVAISGGTKILLAGSARFQNALLRLLIDSTADSDGDQIPDAIEALVGTNPLVKDNDIFSPGAGSARLFAMQMYRDFLGREGDPAGVDGWTNAVANGAYTRAQVIDAFLSSQEFSGFVAPVVRLYFATFLRVPDYAGLTFNAGLVRAGTVTITQLADFFTQSPEFQATYGALNDTQFVTLLYNNVLGRAPDTAGLNGWVALLQGGYTRGQVLMGFSESVEYQATIANDVFVSMMYTGMLRRTPEPAGLNGWVNLLETGTPRETVINGFFLSTEYRARFLP